MESTVDKKTILMFGFLGAGKSTISNALLGYDAFKTGNNPRGVTKEPD